MTTLMKRLVAKAKVLRSRPRPSVSDADDTLPLLEQFLSAYWPGTRTERTTDAAGAAALIARVPGLPNWVFTPTPGLRSLIPGDELAANKHRGWWGETADLPNDAAIGSTAGARWWRRPRPNTAAIG